MSLALNKPLGLSVLFLMSAAVLACAIEPRLMGSLPVSNGRGMDPLSRLIGDAKEVIGDTLFLKADS